MEDDGQEDEYVYNTGELKFRNQTVVDSDFSDYCYFLPKALVFISKQPLFSLYTLL